MYVRGDKTLSIRPIGEDCLDVKFGARYDLRTKSTYLVKEFGSSLSAGDQAEIMKQDILSLLWISKYQGHTSINLKTFTLKSSTSKEKVTY